MATFEKYGAFWVDGNEGEIVLEEFDPRSGLLGAVFHHPSSFYRAVLFRKQSGEPEFIGMWWTRMEDAVFDNLAESQKHIRAFFRNE